MAVFVEFTRVGADWRDEKTVWDDLGPMWVNPEHVERIERSSIDMAVTDITINRYTWSIRGTVTETMAKLRLTTPEKPILPIVAG